MPDRTLVFGTDGSDARYRVRDDNPSGSGDLLVERLDASGTVVDSILGWDDAAEEWNLPSLVVDVLNGADVTAAGSGEVPVAQGDGTLAFGDAGADTAVTGAIATEVGLPK